MTARNPSRTRRRSATLLAAATLVVAAGCSTGEDTTSPSTADPSEAVGSGDGPFGPRLPANPHLGPAGSAAMHGDSGSSDTSPFRLPLDRGAEVRLVDMGAVCSLVAIGSDGMPVALCTRIPDAVPVVHLLDPGTGSSLASMEMVAGSLLGGVYGYLDHEDRLVMVDGSSTLLRIGHRRDGASWVLEQQEATAVAESVPAGDAVTSVAPDYGGGVWFATGGGTVGLVDREATTSPSSTMPTRR